MDDDLWREVGRLLQAARKERGWKHPIDVYRNGGPHNSIVKQHERGRFLKLSTLNDHAATLDLAVTDILQAALARTSEPLNPVAARLARQIERLSPKSRDIVRQLVQKLLLPKPPSSGS